jgi:PAS domain S-box-containing protein
VSSEPIPTDAKAELLVARTAILPALNHPSSPELQLIYDTAPIGLAFLTPDCRYVLINQRLTEICGVSVAGHIGRSVRETVPQVADQVERIVQTVVNTGDPIIGVEINGQRADNADRFWTTHWHPLKDGDGRVVGINVAAEEITERKRAQAALFANEQQLRDLADTLAERVAIQARERDRIWNVTEDLFAVAETDGRIKRVNPAWTRTLGWSEIDVVNKTPESLVHPDDLERTHTELRSLLAGQKTTQFENRLRRRDGEYSWLSWRAVLDHDVIFGVARDITELKHAEEQLRASERELAQVSRQTTMGAMTASIAHEVSQPLGAIVANANAALRWLERPEPDVGEVRAALGRIVNEGHRASEVISSIRGMFGKSATERSQVDVNVLIGEVLSLVRGEMESREVVLQCDTAEGGLHVFAERVQLQQVLINLVTNAIDAMSGVVDRERLLKVSSELRDCDEVEICVEDSGTGIDEDDMPHLFEAFFTTKPHGMGMGLSICRSIIESHGGRLWASPGRPHGATFFIRLPTRPTEAGPQAKPAAQ